MSWPRRHELIDVDLDAYEDDEPAPASGAAQPAEPTQQQTVEERRVSALEAAERAGVPLEELLPRLDRT